MVFDFLLIPIAFLAGITTVFAPCVFTFLPVVLGASDNDGKVRLKKPLTIVMALAVSVFTFTLLLRASTTLIDVDTRIWEMLAGGIILLQGLLILFPGVWEAISVKLGLSRVNSSLEKSRRVGGTLGDILTGVALGPIFSACSPTYGFIVGLMLTNSVEIGLVYLIVYVLGLAFVLIAIAFLGQKLVARLKWGTDPKGTFKRVVAVIFIVMGWIIFFGIHKDIEAFIIDRLPFLDVTHIERQLLDSRLEN